jgi:hypothetical protein
MNVLKEGKRMAERIGGMQDEKVALVLSGGIGLGAYQAGAYAELHEQGEVPRLDRDVTSANEYTGRRRMPAMYPIRPWG